MKSNNPGISLEFLSGQVLYSFKQNSEKAEEWK